VPDCNALVQGSFKDQDIRQSCSLRGVDILTSDRYSLSSYLIQSILSVIVFIYTTALFYISVCGDSPCDIQDLTAGQTT